MCYYDVLIIISIHKILFNLLFFKLISNVQSIRDSTVHVTFHVTMRVTVSVRSILSPNRTCVNRLDFHWFTMFKLKVAMSWRCVISARPIGCHDTPPRRNSWSLAENWFSAEWWNRYSSKNGLGKLRSHGIFAFKTTFHRLTPMYKETTEVPMTTPKTIKLIFP